MPQVSDEDVPTSTEQTLSARPEQAAQPMGDRKQGPFRALRHRNFRVFWIGQLISLIGTWAQNLAQGWLIVLLVDPATRALLHSHGGQAVGAAQNPSPAIQADANFYSGWVNFAGGIPIFLLTLIAGVVADRVDKRRLLLGTQGTLIFSALGLGILCATGRVELWEVMFFAALSGIAAAFDLPTRQSFIVELVGREDLPSAIALNSGVFNAARAVGPALVGLLLAAKVSIGAAFLGNAGLSLAVIVGLLMIRLRPSPKAEEAGGGKSLGGVWENMREGFRYVGGNANVRNLVILVGSFGTFAFSFNILIPVFVRYTLLPHASGAVQVRAFGFMETVRGLGALGGALTVALLSNPRCQRDMLIAGSLLATVFLIVFALAKNLWLAYAMMAVVSYGFVVCFANSNTLMQLTVPHALRGRVLSIYTLMFIGTMPFGALFAGWLAKYVGAPVTMLVCAVISLITVIVVVFRPGGLRTMQVQGQV